MIESAAPAPARVTIGVDIGGTNIRAARVDAAGGMSGHVKVRTGSGPSVPDLVRDLVQRLLDDDVVAVGIGIPGRLDHDGSSILSAGYVDLAGLRLGEALSESVGRPVGAGQRRPHGTRGGIALGAAMDVQHVVMFTVGTGIGGAVARSRTVLRGKGNAGQLRPHHARPAGPDAIAAGVAAPRYSRPAAP